MQTKYIIQMTFSTRPDLEYFFAGCKRGNSVFELKKAKAKRYAFIEEANRDARTLAIMNKPDTFKVISIRCRA